MKKPNNKNTARAIAAVLVAIFCFITIIYSWQMLGEIKIKNLVAKVGLFGPLLIIIYIALSHILAPVAGTPGVLASALLFGVPKTILLIYIAGLISATINFWISKKLGRIWIQKLAGKKTLQKIDGFSEVFGIKILILSRIFGFALFEIVSYAAGLTQIKFKEYFFLTLVFSAIPATIFGAVFRDADLQSGLTLAVWLGIIITSGTIFAFFIKKTIASTKQKLRNH